MSALDFTAMMREEKKIAKAKLKNASRAGVEGEIEGGQISSEGAVEEGIEKKKITDTDTGKIEGNETIVNSIPPIALPTAPPLSPPSPAPAGLDYYADFIDEETEMAIASYARSHQNWNTLKHAKRRVLEIAKGDVDWGGCDGSYIETLCNVLISMGVFPSKLPPNHLLINEYTGCQGILPHTDGPMYNSTTATLSLESSTIFYFKKRLRSDEIGVVNDEVIGGKVLLKPRSLVVFAGDWYEKYLHGIDEEQEEECGLDVLGAEEGESVVRGHRISLTLRHKY
ncbi:hypothetical protein TL16_g08710 [Triparma laevis f. inornata]|uniref:Fe2OG dioxygenase domain-containing protein n=1 Tax=Triparma laevis f. inornata TaxID=1714386 RepID=A0A9W7EJ30_9STRA|nr:hypothetical protein TL16_g08710 [Triparma laevis f. inornata]